MEKEEKIAEMTYPDPNQTGPEPLSRKLKFLTAAAIFYGNVAFGTAFNSFGPSLTSMQNKYETDDETISRVFTVMTGCNMFGALCASFIYRFINRQLAVAFILFTMGAMMLVIPHCPTMTYFFIASGVLGFCGGLYDVAQIVWMIEMMQSACPPYCQAQHFFYALGTVFSPLLLAPFLDEEEDDEEGVTLVPKSWSLLKNEESKQDKLFIPYTILGCFIILSTAFQLLLFFFLRYREPPPELEETPSLVEDKQETKQFMIGSWPLRKVVIVIFSCFIIGASQGMEMTVMQFFPKFGQNSDLHLTEAQSTYVLTGMNAAYAAARAAAIFIVFKINPQLILVANIVLTFLANILLIGWAQSSLPVLWTSSILFGIGFSSTWASFAGFMERYLKFTNFVGSLLIVFGGGTAAIYPLVVGPSIENNPIAVSYVTFFSLAVLTISVSVLSYMTFKDKRRY